MPFNQLLTIIFILGWAHIIAAQAGGIRPPPGKKFKPRREDIPYIKCQVCEQLATHAWKIVKEMKKEAPKPGYVYNEAAVIEKVERMAVIWRDEGAWILNYHPVEKDNRLLLKDMGEPGDCGRECKTVEVIAQDILESYDADIAETLFLGRKNRSQFTKWLCHELTGACKNKPADVPKSRVPSAPFTPRTAEVANLDKMMGEMAEQGMKGQVYSKDDVLKQYLDSQSRDDAEGKTGETSDKSEL